MAITANEFQLISAFVKEHSGICLTAGKEYLLESRLGGLMRRNGCETFLELHKKLQQGVGNLRSEVIDSLTTNETLWFRDNSFFSAMADSIIPMLLEKARTKSRINIWSMASSTGQEAYSVAMLIDNIARIKGASAQVGKFKIFASDISPSAIAMASKGQYSQLAITRGMRKEFLTKYFVEKDNTYQIDAKIMRMVDFKQFNLKDSYFRLGKFDLILCRNVLIYFSDDMIRNIYSNIHSVLEKDGHLAIGSTESPRSHTTQFDQILMNGAAFFKPK
ncbi:MAG: protein-glutamate O-methyltransferase CheR [Magnetococcales bacterium]|nr:protein-glutamate O-methyltransferase CheR [Magnetococcales bacterium]